MRIITAENKITLDELRTLAQERFGDMVKAVVDIEREVLAVGGELHSDEEALLLDDGSKQRDLWGINLWVERPRDQWIEYDSVINIRPGQNNRSKGVEDSSVRNRIVEITKVLLP